MTTTTFRNSFRWGICIISDVEMYDVPELDGEVGRSDSALVLRVHDPTATDQEVEVHCHQSEKPRTPIVQAVLEVSSKRLSIGDANGERVFDVPTGWCDVNVVATPRDAPTRIDVWLRAVETEEAG